MENVRFGVQLESADIPTLIRRSKFYEENDFDSIWLMDHYVEPLLPTAVYPELYTSMTAIGMNTSKILIGSAVTDILRRHPSAIAQTVATLDHLTDGRIALGVGAGEAINLQPYGISIKNLIEKFKEGIQAIRLLWGADYKKTVDFNGRFYSLKNAFLQIRPLNDKNPPIYIGAYGPKMLRLTGEVGDGWMPFAAHTPKIYKESLENIMKSAEKTDRQPTEIEPAYITICAISRDKEDALRTVEEWAKIFLIFAPECLRKITPKIKHPGLNYTLAYSPRSKAEWDVILNLTKEIPSEQAAETVIYGTIDDCIDQIERFGKAGCRHMILYFLGANIEEISRLFSEKVITYFRR